MDFLQDWSWKKRFERLFKIYIARKDPDGLSVMEPEAYKIRFQQNLLQIFDTTTTTTTTTTHTYSGPTFPERNKKVAEMVSAGKNTITTANTMKNTMDSKGRHPNPKISSSSSTTTTYNPMMVVVNSSSTIPEITNTKAVQVRVTEADDDLLEEAEEEENNFV